MLKQRCVCASPKSFPSRPPADSPRPTVVSLEVSVMELPRSNATLIGRENDGSKLVRSHVAGVNGPKCILRIGPKFFCRTAGEFRCATRSFPSAISSSAGHGDLNGQVPVRVRNGIFAGGEYWTVGSAIELSSEGPKGFATRSSARHPGTEFPRARSGGGNRRPSGDDRTSQAHCLAARDEVSKRQAPYRQSWVTRARCSPSRPWLLTDAGYPIAPKN